MCSLLCVVMFWRAPHAMPHTPPPTTYVWIVVPLVLTPDLILLPTALHCLQLCAVKLLVAGSSGRAGAVVAQRVGGG